MKKLIVLTALILVGLAGWKIGSRLSSDALGMGLGVLFGVLAGVPTAMMMMASTRRRDDQVSSQTGPRQGQPAMPYGYQQPPVIVVAGHGAPPQLSQQSPHAGGQAQGVGHGLLPAPPETVDARQFRVVGEQEEWVDEW